MENCLFKILLFAFVITGSGTDANAQGFDLTKKGGNEEIELTADNSLEWQQKEKTIIADGNAFAKKGDVSIRADRMHAFYRTTGKKNDIYMVSGKNNIVIKSATEKATGNDIIYDIDKGVMVLTGSPATAYIRDNVLTSDVFEYWQFQNMAVSRGNAKIVKDDGKTVTAKIMTAHFGKKGQNDNKNKTETGQLEIEYVDLFDDIVFTGEDEKIYADRARYNLTTMIIRMEGNIRMEKGKSRLAGSHAIVNMKTGISKLFKNGQDKVKGVFIPDEYSKNKKKEKTGGKNIEKDRKK